MAWIDIVIIVLVTLSTVIGLFGGAVKEILSLIAWVAAFTLPWPFKDTVAFYLQPYITIEPIRVVAAILGIFFVTLIFFSILNRMICKLISSAGLTGTDRFLGVIFGLFRGILIVTIMVVFTRMMPPITQSQAWQDSLLIPYLEKTASWIKQYIPKDWIGGFSYSSTSTTIQAGKHEIQRVETIIERREENLSNPSQ